MHNTKISNISVLIAEDEEKLLNSMTEYLQLFFENVYAAKDGLEAYQIYQKQKPNIIIADIHMPHLDGLSMMEKIRINDKQTKMIIITAHSEKEKLMQAIELHLVKYLIKPIHSDTLKNLLLEVVEELHQKSDHIYLKNGFYWDRDKEILFKNKIEIPLKEKEKKTIALFCSKINQTISAIDIYNHIYEDYPQRNFSSYSITSLIKRIRSKLPSGVIENVYGVGYILRKSEKL